jgi:DNA-binding transcriptional LysR family regulator
MDLRRIRHFSVLAETLNFSRTAERLHIAQPALSVSIQKLENELGTKLFERTSTGVKLTASGEAALLEARRMLYHAEQMVRAARDAARGTSGRLRIGFVGSAIFRVIPQLIPRYRALYPDVELVLQEAVSHRIVEMLREEALDVGVVRTPLLQPSAVRSLTLQRDRFLLAVPRAHPLAARERAALGEMRDQPFVMYPAGDASGLHSAAMAACQSAGFMPAISQEASQIATVLALVAAGLGVALVPEVMRDQSHPQIEFVELEDHGEVLETTLALVYMPGSESPACQRFVELCSAGD